MSTGPALLNPVTVRHCHVEAPDSFSWRSSPNQSAPCCLVRLFQAKIRPGCQQYATHSIVAANAQKYTAYPLRSVLTPPCSPSVPMGVLSVPGWCSSGTGTTTLTWTNATALCSGMAQGVGGQSTGQTSLVTQTRCCCRPRQFNNSRHWRWS